MANYSIN